MREDQLTVRVIPREDHVPVDAFVSLIQNTLGILRAVDAEVSEQRFGSLDWQIESVSHNSPLTMVMFGEPKAADLNYGPAVITAYTEGLRQIDASPDRIPDFFTVDALQRAKNLVSVLSDGIARITYSTPHQESVVPTQRVAANVDELTQTYEELTSFEGSLETVTIHGRYRFYVWDPFDGRIKCQFSEELLEDVRAALNHRVSVYGRARFSRSGRPLSIDVLDLTLLRDQSELPQAKDFEGINITGGLSSEAYVRSLRDAE